MEITEALFEEKERQMSEKVKKIPLSNDTSTRRTEVLAHDLVKESSVPPAGHLAVTG